MPRRRHAFLDARRRTRFTIADIVRTTVRLSMINRITFQAPLPYNSMPITAPPDAAASSPSTPATVFVRHPRARRYLIRVADDGTVRVTVPRWGSRREAVAFVERERLWIEMQRLRAGEERARRAQAPALPTDPSADAELRER